MTHEDSNGMRNKLPIEAEEPKRLVKASFTDSSITVYQAYPREIAERAVHAGTFVAPFKKERMTWIKPRS